jgi:hypothetical protein
LQDALAVQKNAQERRLHQHGTAAKVQLWIDQELEVLVSTLDAERTLEQLLEDRATLHGQLDQLNVMLLYLWVSHLSNWFLVIPSIATKFQYVTPPFLCSL